MINITLSYACTCIIISKGHIYMYQCCVLLEIIIDEVA